MTEYRGQGTADASTATTTSVLREAHTATSGQTVFTLATALYTPGTNELSVYVEGAKKLLTTDYTETSGSVVTFGSGVTLNEVVEFVAVVGGQALDVADASLSTFTHDQSGAIQTTVDAALKALAVDLTADLKVVAGNEVQAAYVRGRDTTGDAYAGFYYWDPTSTATDTSATTTLVVQQAGVATGRWLRTTSNVFSGDVTFGDDIIVDGTTDSTTVLTGSIQTDGGAGIAKNAVIGQDLVLAEQADHSSTPGNGYGYLWVKTGAPSTLQFTDDAGSDTDISAAGGTVTVADEAADTTCFPIFSTAATGSISPKSNAALTFNSATADLGCTTFTGALVGNASTATTAGTVTTAAQANITSLGTLTSLDIDNIQINLNTISSTGGTDLNITPLAGQQIVLDGAIVVDAGVVTGVTSLNSITSAELAILDGATVSTAELNLLTGKSLASADDVIDNFPAGTIMSFQQTNAPTGWTKEATHNNKAFRVVTGSASSGGTRAFTTQFADAYAGNAHTLVESEIPGHTHDKGTMEIVGTLTGTNLADKNVFGAATGAISVSGGQDSAPPAGTHGAAVYYQDFTFTASNGWTGDTSSTGDDGSHSHTVDLAVQYVDLILAAKD